MMGSEFVSALSVGVSLVGIVAVLALYRDYQVDMLRENIFAVREELFLYASDEGLLDHVAYRNFRFLLNSLLRYGHRASFLRVGLMALGRRMIKIPPTSQAQWLIDLKLAVESLPHEQRTKFTEFDAKARNIVILHMARRSVLFWLAGIAAGTYLILKRPVVTSFPKVWRHLKSLVPVLILEEDALKSAS